VVIVARATEKRGVVRAIIDVLSAMIGFARAAFRNH
jgi:hypothetical protein